MNELPKEMPRNRRQSIIREKWRKAKKETGGGPNVISAKDEEAQRAKYDSSDEENPSVPECCGEVTCEELISYEVLVAAEPQTYQEAVTAGDNKNWRSAMEHEMKSLAKYDVFKWTRPPNKMKPLPQKWVYKRKRDGSYRARTAVKGFLQNEETL